MKCHCSADVQMNSESHFVRRFSPSPLPLNKVLNEQGLEGGLWSTVIKILRLLEHQSIGNSTYAYIVDFSLVELYMRPQP